MRTHKEKILGSRPTNHVIKISFLFYFLKGSNQTICTTPYYWFVEDGLGMSFFFFYGSD